jgi:hypothetical protein
VWRGRFEIEDDEFKTRASYLTTEIAMNNFREKERGVKNMHEILEEVSLT